MLHQVHARHKFGDRVFHLQARVHFEEEEGAVLARHKFHRAGAVVVHGLGQRHGLLAHEFPGLGVEQWRRCFLHHLLIAALDGTLALTQMDHIAVLVAEHLNFNMARVDDEFFEEDAVIAKAGFRL